MKLHQVLTGACNAGDRCFAVGSVEGIPFVTYAAGSNIVILSVTFERVQIIPGICHQNVQISCIDCSTDTGKIAAAYGNKVKIFEPTPLVHHNSAHKLDYHWVETGQIQTEYFVRAISWNLEGTRLLLGGRLLQLWTTKANIQESQEDIYSKGIHRSATFQLGAGNDGESDDDGKDTRLYDVKEPSSSKSPPTGDEGHCYELAWETRTSSPVRLMSFSPDGTLFATAGMNDPLVKVWYQDKPLLFPSKSMEHLAATSPTCSDTSTQYAFEYLAHPAAVLSVEWRRTSKYMPRGSVANMLVTSCEDSICRVWVETVLPEDGLVNMSNFDPLAAQNPRFRTHRHKHKFIQRLKHMRHCFQLKRHLKQQNGSKSPKRGSKAMTIPTLFSSYSVHDYHSYGIHGTGQTNGLHFHLAATINAQTDIPLVPSLGEAGNDKGFVVHWLNNKEMHFTLQAEYILQELSKKAVGRDESLQNIAGGHEPEEGRAEETDHESELLKRKKLRATTGDLAKFLRTEQDLARNIQDLPSPHGGSHLLHPDPIMSNTASLYSITTDITGVTGFGVPLGDALDHRIETLLKDWHHSPDLLYAVHPLDGSYLVWLVDWLDEYNPGSFRQAQVSFSSRLPNAVPLGDASTLSTHLALFNPFHVLDLRNLLHLEGPHSLQSPQPVAPTNNAEEDGDEETQSVNHVSTSTGQGPQSVGGPSPASEEKVVDNNNTFNSSSSPVVAMVTKHANGTLNLWHLALSDQSKFTQVLSVSHVTRISGHRFRVNSISCHPVLPLLLTTSHHNVINSPDDKEIYGTNQKHRRESGLANHGYCSELILWKVETVGPLGKSGGVKELARINSPQMSAFASVAWIPTVLPSSSLGGYSNSASACFVASDGQSLRIYQAVIDARTLLAQILITPTLGPNNPFNNVADVESPLRQFKVGNRTPVRIVSEQSTSRPGCILELDAIVEGAHDWKQTQFLHVFQQQLLTGYRLTNNIATPSGVHTTDSSRPAPPPVVAPPPSRKMPLSQMPLTARMSLMEVSQSAVVDLQESQAFSEPFYVVVIEKENLLDSKQSDSFGSLGSKSSTARRHNDTEELPGATVVHVWKLVISSCNEDQGGIASPLQKRPSGPNVTMKTIKMCTQRLPLPDGVGIIHATPAAGHLSSASIYPACFAPYAMVTACTDDTVRFWRCKLVNEGKTNESAEEYLRWEEWQMISKEGNSLLPISGRPLSVSVAYSGRIAVAFKNGKSFKGKYNQNNRNQDADTRYFDLVVSIYECESTGGSEWVQEDVIYLKNIRLPRLPPVDPNIDLAYLQEEGEHWLKKRQVGIETLTKNLSHDDLESQDKDGSYERFQPNIQGLLSVPSYATLLTLKKSIEHRGNVCPLTQKNLVQLDWVSKEDGSHILTVGVGHRVLLYTAVSSPAVKERFSNSKIVKNPKLARQSSTTSSFNQDDVTIRWMRLRSLDLRTADGLPPLPMHLSWVRDGIFVVGMDNEMQVYSQWKDTLCGISNGTGMAPTCTITVQGPIGDDSGTDVESDTEGGSVGYDDDVGEDRDVLDRELHTLAKEGRISYAPSMAQLPRASSMHALAAAHVASNAKKVTLNTPKKKLEKESITSPTVSLLQDCLPSYGLFEASQIACPVLPQYHPQQLMELLNSGKIRWVKAILAHLVRCISGQRGTDSDDEDDEDGSLNQDSDSHTSAKHWARTRTLSISSPDREARSISAAVQAAVPKELTLDYTEISAVPPLPLWLLLAADQGSANLGDASSTGTESLFHPSLETHDEEEEDLDVILSESPPKRKNKRKNNEASSAQHLQQQYFQFGPRQAALLTSVLTHTQLPGLSSVDQMHLLALADTLASCSATHLVTSTMQSTNTKHLSKGSSHTGSESSLDSCGLRFLLAARHHSYLLRCLPPTQRGTLKKQGISSSLLTWAFHSEAQDELVQLLPAFTKPNPTWADYREIGFGWWIRNNGTLRRCIEKLAKAAYQSQGDPLDAALYYLAMKKKNLVWGLFRQVQNERMTQFFSNNFTEERWRKAALKNAYALLGKQRFEHAVAFFLLAGSLKDAIDICLSRMHDIQLAIVVTRLYEGDMELVPPGLKKLLNDHVLNYNESNEPTSASACTDPFLRSMSYWLLAQYTDSLSTLLERRGDKGEIRSQTVASPSVFNFYIYLRNHPLIIRQQLALSAQGGAANNRTHLAGVGAISVDKTYLLQEWITPLERRLYFTTAHAHFLAGCPALALEVLSKLPDHVQQPDNETASDSLSNDNAPKIVVEEKSSSEIDWSTPVTNSSAKTESLEFDWGQPTNGSSKLDTLELKWSDDENSDSEESDGGITMKEASLVDIPETKSEQKLDAEPENGGLDIMAQQLKFVACLKILMGEMATLATGFEVDGGQLRLQLYLWLDRELQALQQLCNYAPKPVAGSDGEEDEPSLLPAIPSSYKQPITANEPVTLHEILLAEKLDLEAKVKRTNRRRKWLKANELLVRTLLSYCSVHGSQGGGLASVRMELILLLQELQQDRRFTTGSESNLSLNQPQLSSPLAYPTSLPLLAASVAGTEIITTDPVRHLESQIRDLLRAIIGLNCVPVPGKISFGQMCLIRDLALALSACLYQALCSSDAWSLQQQQQEQQRDAVGPLARLAVVFRAMHNIGVSNNSTKREETQLCPTSSPSKWPGVTSLRALLAREKDEDAPRLLTLLCEAFVAIYTSLLCYSMAACDSHVLYRLAGLQPTEEMWGSVYGGGAKQLVRVTTTSSSLQGGGGSMDTGSPQPPGSPTSSTAMDFTKQRVRLHIKLLQQIGTPASVGGGLTTVPSTSSISSSSSRKVSLPTGNEDMPTYKEVFVAPQCSLVACLMKKPALPAEKILYDYDSSASDAGDEVDGEEEDDNETDNDDFWEELDSAKRASAKKAAENPGDTEHSKPDSISWQAMRLAVTRLCINQMEEFLRVAGVEPQDLPVVSPLSHAITRTMNQWCTWLQKQLELAGPAPPNFIPGCVVENAPTGPPILKYRSLLDPNNTPFAAKEESARPVRRLWAFLVRQEKVQDIFIRLVFGKKHVAHHSSGAANADSASVYSDAAGQDELGDTLTAVSGGNERLQDPVRIIHKDQDIISAFCLNTTNAGMLALANAKEIQELDITPLLDMQSSVLEDECELDLLGLDRDLDGNASSYLVVQTPGDRQVLNQLNGGMTGSASTAHFPSYAPSASNSVVPPGGPALHVTGRGTTLLRKHKVDGVRRMIAHPLLPLYVAGQGDGSVSIWEWGHVGVVAQPRAPGTYAKVNRLRFNSQGNKFGVADGDGHVALWTLRLGGGSTPHRPFFTHQCHSKGTSDFVFLGSSSVLATTGHSSESRNVVLWDTLMPQRKAVIHSFVCHENGGTSLLYASQHQLLISAGRKGIVCLWDLRQRTLRHKFTAHESSVAVKCMALDPNEEFFATGSADGDVKVWSLASQHLLYAFPAEHSRSSFFRSMGQGNGVNQLHLDSSGRLFSCGSDGSMKLRQLPYVGNRESIVSTLY